MSAKAEDLLALILARDAKIIADEKARTAVPLAPPSPVRLTGILDAPSPAKSAEQEWKESAQSVTPVFARRPLSWLYRNHTK